MEKNINLLCKIFILLCINLVAFGASFARDGSEDEGDSNAPLISLDLVVAEDRIKALLQTDLKDLDKPKAQDILQKATIALLRINSEEQDAFIAFIREVKKPSMSLDVYINLMNALSNGGSAQAAQMAIKILESYLAETETDEEIAALENVVKVCSRIDASEHKEFQELLRDMRGPGMTLNNYLMVVNVLGKPGLYTRIPYGFSSGSYSVFPDFTRG